MKVKVAIACVGLALAAWVVGPGVAAAADSNLACYQAKDLKIPAKLASKQTGTYASFNDAGIYDKCKLKYVCGPADVDGSGVPNPSQYYLCHQCKGFKGAINWGVSDQFVFGTVQFKKLKFLCLPGSVF